MEFNFIRNKINHGYITIVDPSSKPRVLCFKNKTSANVCLKHLARFRAKHGTWPSMDLTSPSVMVVNKKNFKKRSPIEIEKYLEIDTMEIKDVDEIGITTNTSFLYCHNFGVLLDGMSISFSGQEIDSEPDPLLYINHLNLHI